MATYEFRYIDPNTGAAVIVERRFPMSNCPERIAVDLSDGITTIATKILSMPARMKINWDSYEPSDLPPIDYQP